MEFSRLTIITGHYGSGKTNLSVNIALDIAAAGRKCTVIDLDIVNPYFRTADFGEIFRENGVTLHAPVYANTNLDIPALNIPLEGILKSGDYVVIDVGGDDEGAKALGGFAGTIQSFGDAEMLYVVNKYRYLTREPSEALALMREIEAASGLCCTGIVNNSNLGSETTAETVLSSVGFAEAVCKEAGLPLYCTVCREDFPKDIPKAYKARLFVKKPWETDIDKN